MSVTETIMRLAKARGLKHSDFDNGRGMVRAAPWLWLQLVPPSEGDREMALEQLDQVIALLLEAKAAATEGPARRHPPMPARRPRKGIAARRRFT